MCISATPLIPDSTRYRYHMLIAHIKGVSHHHLVPVFVAGFPHGLPAEQELSLHFTNFSPVKHFYMYNKTMIK